MKYYLLFFTFTIFSFTSFQAQTIFGDTDSDGCVNLDDILNVLSTYGQCLDECGVPNGDNSTCHEGMVEVSGGDYLYGDSNETAYLPTFYIDVYEVSAGDYKACVDAGECSYNGGTESYHTYNNDKDAHPINYVNWNESTAYCAWKGKRLPTEQEWEKAARGTDGRTYPWGEDPPICERVVMGGCDGDTQPVGSLETGSSIYGAYDMAGNVGEWTNSWYYSDSMTYRVLRGGSFNHLNDFNYFRSSNRDADYPHLRSSSFGFRCVKD